jgi:hypothetical protein
MILSAILVPGWRRGEGGGSSSCRDKSTLLADLSQMVVTLDSITFSPPTLPDYIWSGYTQVGKLQLSEAVFVGEDGKVYVRPAEVRDIQAFARIWDRNLKHQGFMDAAESQVGG